MRFTGRYANVGAQAVEVFSIRIRSHSSDEKCGIFGTIYVKDDIPGDDMLCLYNRGSTDVECIYSSGTSLSLSDTARPIVDTKQLIFVFDLKNAFGDEFMKGSYPLDIHTDSYDRCLSIVCKGSLGFATIYYSMLSAASTAYISAAWVKAGKEFEMIMDDNRGLAIPLEEMEVEEMEVEENKVEEPESDIRYYGSIVAYYEKKSFKYPCGKDQKQHYRIMLLNITKDHCVLRNGGEIPLSRSRVTVPVFSLLVVKVKLTAIDFSGEVPRKCSLRDKLVYETMGYGRKTKAIRKLDRSFCATLNWTRAEIPLVGVRPERRFCWGGEIMDVSSVRIVINQSTDDKRDIEVYGTIHASDCDDITLFSHEKGDSVRLLSGDVLPLDCLRRCIIGSHCGIMLSLKEKSQDLEICHGHFGHYPYYGWTLHEKRLAAVFEGKDGYAVVNFTLYSSAVQALIEAKLCVDTDAEIYGRLVARIGNNEYAGGYVNKYFESRLFDVPKANRVMLKPNCESGQPACKQILLPLSIVAVAVPGNCPLIIEANLAYRTAVSKEWVKIEGLVKMNPYGIVSESSDESKFHYGEGYESGFHIGKENDGVDVRIGWFSSPMHTRTLCKTYTGKKPIYPPEAKSSFKWTVTR